MTVLDGDVLRVSCNFELGDGTLYQNIYHWIRDGTDPVNDATHLSNIELKIETAYDELDALVKDDVTPQLCFVDRVEFNEITNQWEVVENIGTFSPAFNPSDVGDSLPYQSSPYVVFKTQRPKSVGKKFLFPLGESQQDSTIMVGGAVTAITAYAALILAAIPLGGDATLGPVIVRTAFNTVLPLLVAVVNDVLGSQKRRRPGVGA